MSKTSNSGALPRSSIAMSPPSLSLPRSLLSLLFVFHCTEHIAFGILEPHEFADGWNDGLRHDNFPTICLGERCDRVRRLDADRALVSDHSLPRHQFASLLEGPLNAGILRSPRMEQVKAWRSPGLELPAEHILVEASGPRQIIGVDREMTQVPPGSVMT